MLAAANRRAAEREQNGHAVTWGIANDTLALPSAENVSSRVSIKRVVFAHRQDPFDALHCKGGLSDGQHQAAMRLYKNNCLSMGIRTDDPLPDLGTVVDRQRSSDLATIGMIDANHRFLAALRLVGRADAPLLKALVQPEVMCGGPREWRGVVQRVTGEDYPSCQGSLVRQACENLRLAYIEIDYTERERRQASLQPADVDCANDSKRC